MAEDGVSEILAYGPRSYVAIAGEIRYACLEHDAGVGGEVEGVEPEGFYWNG